MSTNRAPLDPTMEQILGFVAMPSIAELGHQKVREVLREQLALMPPPVEVSRVQDRTIDDGIGVRIYWPVADPADLPVVVFFHGGGFVIGDLDSHDPIARGLALGAGAVVVAVDYRLAPEHPYPAAVEDALTALRWVSEHAAELGADPARLAVAGDSAGGNLSAVVTQLARDAGGPPVAFQLLWYPATTMDGSLPSMAENAQAPVLTAADMAAFSRLYLGDRDPAEQPATLAPARAADLSGLPPAYIATAGHDPLRDDGEHYAELLRAAGVPVELSEAETLVHGYLSFGMAVPAAAEAFARSLEALKVAL